MTAMADIMDLNDELDKTQRSAVDDVRQVREIIHPTEFLRKKLVTEKDIYISELKMIVDQVRNNSFIVQLPEAAELQKACDELSCKFDIFLSPEIVEK